MSFADEYFRLLEEEKKKKKKQVTTTEAPTQLFKLNTVNLPEPSEVKKTTETKQTTKKSGFNETRSESGGFSKEDERTSIAKTILGDDDEDDGKDFDLGTFGDWLGKTATSGLASFNKGLTSTADLILGKPLQAIGWEKNPISSIANYYSKEYDRYKEETDALEAELGGGKGYNVAGDIVEGTVAAVPDALLAIMSAGTSLAGSAAKTTSGLATKAAYEGGNLLSKAGLKVSSMVKNPQYWTSFARTLGLDYEEAKEKGASDTVAAIGSTISSLVNAGVEIGLDGMSGIQGLPDNVAKGGKNAILEWVESALEEGAEEDVQLVVSNIVSKLLYDPETEVLNTKELLYNFGMGAAVGGVLGGGQVATMKAANAVDNAIQEHEAKQLTENEQKVVDKIVEERVAEQENVTARQKAKIREEVIAEMDKGSLSIDTIEEVLGGDTYKAYKDTVDSEEAMFKEYDELYKEFDELGQKTGATLAEQSRYNELKQLTEEKKQQILGLKDTSQRFNLKNQLGEEVFGLVQNDRLLESYNERGRRGQAFEADLSQYDSKYHATYKRAMESGLVNNTRRSHEFVDFIATVEADKGLPFDFTNNKKLAEMGIDVQNAIINGFVTKDGVTLNIDSAKSLNSVVGHEITHILEGTGDYYTNLQNLVFRMAKTKGEYDTRLQAIEKLYEGVEGADVKKELTADLVGDYLFTDPDFIRTLSVEHRNVFQKIYDEIKYLCKVATAGSKEARELAKVQKAFADAYRGEGKAREGTKYSMSDGDYYSRIYDMQVEVNKLTDDVKAFEQREDYLAQMDKVLGALKGGNSDVAINEYTEWMESSGYNALVEKRDALKTELENLRKEWDNQINNEAAEKEKNAIAKSGLSEADYFRKQAVKEFGYTPYFYDAGYITPNGKMLNFSGEKGQHYGSRGQDHRAIGTIYADTQGTDALNRFMRDGNIRIMAESPGIDISTLTEPSKEQYATIRKFINEYSNRGYFNVDLTGEDGRVIGSLSYENRVNSARIINDIKHYYATGEIREQSSLDKFRYSLSDSDGKQLTKEQNEYFKDSKVRDDDGNLMVMYHGSQDAGFHVFDPKMSDDDTSLFFVDRNDVAASYSGTTETYEARTIRTVEDMNNFLAEIDYDHYKAVERNGRFELLENNEFVAAKDTMQELYEEFCWYEGVGEGDANYKVYLNLTNPLVVDTEGRNWNNVSREFSQEVYDRYQSLTAEEKEALVQIAAWEDVSIFRDELRQATDGALASAYEKLGGEDANVYDMFTIASDNFSEEALREFAVKQLKTRDYAARAKEQGYDGVIFKNIHDNGGYSNGSEGASTVAIAFYSNQIKSVANEKPTSDPDIRYSLSDSEGRKLNPAVQKRFGNSKVVDENGSLKVVYHGTATGEFSIFDKSKGSVEGDFGSGFYFTDNEADVSEHYEGGGPDFDNKVARRAEQIESEEEIDYEEAEQRAREELYKGSHKFEVYLNIENPAIVGETMLLDGESYREQYNEEDYEDYDEYIADVEQLLADDIENIVWEVEKNVDVYSTDGISDILYEAYYEGGIGLEELKTKLNNLYLEDSNGNLVANEVARQIIESLGYDGIIDPTVSGKWNMDIEEGTTHYIVFKPNQIKAVTNENPTDNPDIHKSLSERFTKPEAYGKYNVYGKDVALEEVAPTQAPVETVAENATVEAPVVETDDFAPVSEEDAEAINREALDSLTDADMPPEVEAPYYESESVEVDDPFEQRDWWEVGRNRKATAYMYEHPEVKPFFQEEARILLSDLRNTEKGERYYADVDYTNDSGYASHGVWTGQKRFTSESIAEMLDMWKMSYADIEKGLKAIVEDNGAENIAAAKRIEFMLNDRLLNGYTDFLTDNWVEPNQEYKNLVQMLNITEYNEDAFNSLMEQADEYAPPVEEEIAPVEAEQMVETNIGKMPLRDYQDMIAQQRGFDDYADMRSQGAKLGNRYDTEGIAPVAMRDTAPVLTEKYEAIRPKREKGPKLVRADNNETAPSGKQRKWVKTSTDSEAVDGKVLPEDLVQDKIHYQPISNKKTLGNANAKLDNMGYDTAVSYFDSQFKGKNVSLDDIALGERLIQEAVKKGDYKTAGELIQNVAILGTELGQKVQALSIIKRLTPEGQLKMLQKTVERGKTKGDKAFEGVEITQEMIDKILSVYNPDGSYDQTVLNEMVEDVKQKIADKMKVTAMDKVNAWRYLSMLGNPKTHIRNLVSNVAMRGTMGVKNAVARTIETIAPIENRTKTWKAASEEVERYASKTALNMKDIISGENRYSESAGIKQKRQIFQNKILNAVYEFNSDMLGKEDWWFSKAAFTSSLSEFLTANGIRTEQDIKRNPEIVEKARQYAVEQSQIATFRQYSWLANKINEIERKNAATQVAVGSVVPFKKTPINIAKTGLSYSPLGFAKTLTYDVAQVKNGKMEASEMVDHLAQNVTGSALALVGYMLAQSGLLNGAGEDDKEGEYDYQLGEQAYSVNIGGATFSLSWLSPVAMPLFVGVNAYEQLVEGKEWNGDVVVETLAQTLDPLSEMSFISSLDSVLSSYDSGIQKFAGIGETMAQNYITQFAPTLMSQVATVMDDTKRSTKVAGDSDFKFVDQTINKLKYKIPFLRETLEPSTDIWGNEVKQTENVFARAIETFIAPYAKRDDIATEIDEEIKGLYRETGDTGLIPSVPYNYLNYDGEKYKMSAEDYTEFKKEYGQKAFSLMEELFATETYNKADSETQAEYINDVYDYARDEAKREYFAKHGVEFTNATSEGKEYYKENPIKGAIEKDITPEEYVFSEEYPEKYAIAKKVGGYDAYMEYKDATKDMKLAEKAAYIANMDLTTAQKNALINGETDRKEPIDLTGYNTSDYSSFEEFEYAKESPGKYGLAKAVGGYEAYKGYSSELYDIKADKDENGKSISGSRKEKVADYINGLDADYYTKIILFKKEYNSEDTYNTEIINYLNSRDDISFEEEILILRELGFEVDSQGNISW